MFIFKLPAYIIVFWPLCVTQCSEAMCIKLVSGKVFKRPNTFPCPLSFYALLPESISPTPIGLGEGQGRTPPTSFIAKLICGTHLLQDVVVATDVDSIQKGFDRFMVEEVSSARGC